jgi:hypothetical protein
MNDVCKKQTMLLIKISIIVVYVLYQTFCRA